MIHEKNNFEINGAPKIRLLNEYLPKQPQLSIFVQLNAVNDIPSDSSQLSIKGILLMKRNTPIKFIFHLNSIP